MLEISEAIEAAFACFRPLPAELLGLVEARGRALAEAPVARTDGPSFDASAMDGYAVRAADLGETDRLPVVGESRAGGAWPAPLSPGAAMRIYTGAPLPAGADAVVAQEDVERNTALNAALNANEPALFRVRPRPGQHVRARGSDLRADAVLVPAGHLLRPASIALLASQGVAFVSVHRRPVVSVLCSGDELRLLGEPCPPGAIISSNLYALCAAIEEAGGIARPAPTAPDDEAGLYAALERAAEGADVVLTTGGVSVGDHDYMRAAYERLGVRAAVPKVRMKPGKPVTIGQRGAQPVVGLPGNPVSALVTFELFVRPGLRKMLGDPRPFPRLRRAALDAPHARKPGRTELARALFVDTDANVDTDELHVRLARDQGSAALASAAVAEALVVLPGERERFEAGEQVSLIDLLTRPSSAEVPSL